MELTVHLFGPMREAAGASRATVAVEPPATADAVIRALAASHPALRPFLERSRISVNHAYVELASPIRAGDEVAIIPPVGGG